MLRRLVVFAAMVLPSPVFAIPNTAAPPAESPAPQKQTPSFDGLWQGVIKFDKEAFLADTSTPPAGKTFRLEIHDVVVRVFAEEGGTMTEAKPGKFHIAQVDANAVIFATDSDPGAWVESWVFVITKKDDNALIAEYSRLVNNVATPSE